MKRLQTFFVFVLIVLPTSFAFAGTFSVNIQSVYPATTVPAGNELVFSIITSGATGAITYAVTDSFSGSTASGSATVTSGGTFVWIPAVSDAGTHNITINLTDQSGNTGSASIQITVPVNPAVTIQNISPSSGSINAGQTIFWTTAAVGFTNPKFSASDSVMTSSLTPGSMNSSGGFSWTPKNQDVGSHTINVTVTDNYGHSATALQNIYVAAKATADILSLSPGNTVAQKQTVTFTVMPTGFSNPTYVASDSVPGSIIGYANISPAGLFSWTPKETDFGTHTITITVSDLNGNIASVSQQITVANPIATTTTSTAPATTTTPTPVSVSPTSPTITSSPQSSTIKYIFSKPLSFGSSNKDVAELQKRLTALGFYSGPVTGYYGNLTVAAVKKFQATNGLSPLGSVGPGTRATLNK